MHVSGPNCLNLVIIIIIYFVLFGFEIVIMACGPFNSLFDFIRCIFRKLCSTEEIFRCHFNKFAVSHCLHVLHKFLSNQLHTIVWKIQKKIHSTERTTGLNFERIGLNFPYRQQPTTIQIAFDNEFKQLNPTNMSSSRTLIQTFDKKCILELELIVGIRRTYNCYSFHFVSCLNNTLSNGIIIIIYSDNKIVSY